MKTVTAREMQAIDRKAIEEYGIPGLILMENAGRGIAELIFHSFKVQHVCIFCGKGNNGGDGLVIARHLANRGFQVQVLLFAAPETLKADSAVNFDIVRKMGVFCQIIATHPNPLPEGEGRAREIEADLIRLTGRSELVVDALFGVGLEREVTGIYRTAIEVINKMERSVVAVDVPSGLDSDTGEIHGVCVKAYVTATLGLPKTGLLKGSGPEMSGKICVVDIGLPKQAVADVLGETHEK